MTVVTSKSLTFGGLMIEGFFVINVNTDLSSNWLILNTKVHKKLTKLKRIDDIMKEIG